MVTNRAAIHRLQVEYRYNPVGIDVSHPRFSWQMCRADGRRGQRQTAYQIAVSRDDGELFWNSGKVLSSDSLHIIYQGAPLRAATSYNWEVTVWDETGTSMKAEAWFETGLMDTEISAWDGAVWIGGGEADLPLYADYLPLYNLSASIQIARGSERGSIILAANDPRLANQYRNIYQLHNESGQSYFKVELDVGNIAADGGVALLRFYRVGYSALDDPASAILEYEIKPSVINHENRFKFHHLLIHNEYGTLTVQVNNQDDFYLNQPAITEDDPRYPPLKQLMNGARASLNPAGNNHRVITYGMLNEIGFSAGPNQHVRVKNVQVSNVHAPHSVLFKEAPDKPQGSVFYDPKNESAFTVEKSCYVLNGGPEGVSILANPSRNSMPLLRTEFALKSEKIRRARLYVTARGIYDFLINGKRISQDYYNPGLTQYNRTHLYQTYDVTAHLHEGSNAMGAQLAEGWWSGMLGFGNTWNGFGDRQSLLVKLVVEYQDGGKDIIVSNEKDWQFFSRGPVVYGSLVQGEVYDARAEAIVTGWSEPGFDASEWKPAQEVLLDKAVARNIHPNLKSEPQSPDFSQMELVGQIGNPASVFSVVSAQRVKEVRPGVFVYDLGQNIVGVPRIEFENGRDGQEVVLRYAEMLYPDMPESGENTGMILTENYRAALSQDIYIMKAGRQSYQPRFTSHGFQYIEITGLDKPLPLQSVKGVVVSSIRELTAGYSCSNSALNKLWSNIVWSNIDNFLSVPTDCPQRNERMGWSGDINVFSRTASYISHCSQFFRRHLLSMRDTQSGEGRYADIAPVDGGFGGILWGAAGIVLPWEAYWQYNDIGILEENYAAMCHYLNYIDSTLDPETGLSRDQELGDWLGPQNEMLGSAFPATAYHVYVLDIVSRVAEVLGKQEEADCLKGRYRERKAFLNKTFADAADTQSFYAIGLALGVFEDAVIASMAKKLDDSVRRKNNDDGSVVRSEYSLMTGFIATAWIGDALSANGYSDTAYRLFLNDSYPSLLYSVRQGATTIWERLNGYTKEHGFAGNNSMNSFNHYSFGAVGQWLMEHSAGIKRLSPGFKTFSLQPQIDNTGMISEVDAWYESPYGKIESHWSIEGDSLSYEVTVPANTTAMLVLPVAAVSAIKDNGIPVTESLGISKVTSCENAVKMQLESGQYLFSCKL